MSLRINSEAPNFTAETTDGKIDFHQWARRKFPRSRKALKPLLRIAPHPR
jgi:hypothetical protein